MKTIQQKQVALTDVKEKLGKAKIALFTSFARVGGKGLGVADMGKLRRDLRAVNSEYLVQKKTLLGKALKDNKTVVDFTGFEGSFGTVFGYGEELPTIKALYTFTKTNPSLQYFGAVMGSKFFDAQYITELAKLPSKEVLLGQLVGMVAYPLRSLMNVLTQISEKKAS